MHGKVNLKPNFLDFIFPMQVSLGNEESVCKLQFDFLNFYFLFLDDIRIVKIRSKKSSASGYSYQYFILLSCCQDDTARPHYPNDIAWSRVTRMTLQNLTE